MTYLDLFRNKARVALDYIGNKSRKFHNKYGTKYLITVSVALCFAIGIIGAGTVVAVEHNAEGASLTSFWNGLYWSFATMSTVGYGDFYPVTAVGKFIANIIMALGIGLYSFAISLITGLFIHNLMNKSTENCELREQLAKSLENQTILIEQNEIMIANQQTIIERDSRVEEKVDRLLSDRYSSNHLYKNSPNV